MTPQLQNYIQIFTDVSKVDEKVAAAAVSSVAADCPFLMSTNRSLFYLHRRAASNLIWSQSQESKYVRFSDSLSALQALKNNNNKKQQQQPKNQQQPIIIC